MVIIKASDSLMKNISNQATNKWASASSEYNKKGESGWTKRKQESWEMRRRNDTLGFAK